MANKQSELDRLNYEISLANDDLGLQEFGFLIGNINSLIHFNTKKL